MKNDPFAFLKPKLDPELARLVREAKKVPYGKCRAIALSVEQRGKATPKQIDALQYCVDGEVEDDWDLLDELDFHGDH